MSDWLHLTFIGDVMSHTEEKTFSFSHTSMNSQHMCQNREMTPEKSVSKKSTEKTNVIGSSEIGRRTQRSDREGELNNDKRVAALRMKEKSRQQQKN